MAKCYNQMIGVPPELKEKIKKNAKEKGLNIVEYLRTIVK